MSSNNEHNLIFHAAFESGLEDDESRQIMVRVYTQPDFIHLEFQIENSEENGEYKWVSFDLDSFDARTLSKMLSSAVDAFDHVERINNKSVILN